MGIEGLQKVAVIMCLLVGFMLGWFFNGAWGFVNGLAGAVAKPHGASPAHADTVYGFQVPIR